MAVSSIRPQLAPQQSATTHHAPHSCCQGHTATHMLCNHKQEINTQLNPLPSTCEPCMSSHCWHVFSCSYGSNSCLWQQQLLMAATAASCALLTRVG